VKKYPMKMNVDPRDREMILNVQAINGLPSQSSAVRAILSDWQKMRKELLAGRVVQPPAAPLVDPYAGF